MQITVGSILSRSLSALMKNFGVFFVIALIFQIPSALIQMFVIPELSSPTLQGVITNLSGSLFGGLVSGGVLYGVVKSLGGGKANVSDCLGVAFARIVPIFLVSLLVGIGVAIGMLLLIVPGIILAVMWYVAVPATVIEKTGVVDSLSRSAELTKGHRMTLFLAALVFIGVMIVVGLVVLAPMMASGASPLVIALIMLAMAVTIGLWGNVAMGVVYHDLRMVKEGASTSDLAQVFA